MEWFRLQYPNYKNLLFAIPNGGKRHKSVAVKLKAEGVVRGVPDLFLAVGRGDMYHGLFIEMKVGRNKPSEDQKEQMERLKKQGYGCVVCYSFEQFQTIIKSYLR